MRTVSTGCAEPWSHNVSSDDTAAGTGSQTLKTAYSDYFSASPRGSENLHLRDDSATLWGSSGIDLDSDPNLPVLLDIDGDPRDPDAPDIGADEVADLRQTHARWRNDDGGEVAATWAAAEDTALTGLAKDTTRRVRFQVLNANTIATSAAYRLQVALTDTCSTGTYTDVLAGSGPWQIVDSGNITDGEATTNVAGGLTDAGSVFVAGQVRDAASTTAAAALDTDEFTEVEFAVQATTQTVSGASYCFRLLDATRTSPLRQYSSYAEVTMAGTLDTLTLGNHAAGQVEDAFRSTTPVTAPLFAFRLSRAGSVVVDEVRVGFDTTAGVDNADVTGGELWKDVNGDGAIDGGDTFVQTGVTPSAGVLTFTTNFQPDPTGTDYLVRATVANLATGDATTFSLDLAGVDTVEGAIEPERRRAPPTPRMRAR